MKNAIPNLQNLFDFIPQGVLVTDGIKSIYKNSEFDRLINNLSVSSNEFVWRVFSALEIDRGNVKHTSGSVSFNDCIVDVQIIPMEGSIVFLTQLSHESADPFSQFPATMASVGSKFRLPLSLMVSSLSLVANRIRDGRDDKTDFYLAILNQNFYRLLRLSNNISAMVRYRNSAESLKIQKTDIVEFIESLVTPLLPHAKAAGIKLEFEPGFEYKTIEFDADKLELAFYNLLSNSFKYVEKGGRILVRLSGNDGSVFISVSDTGCGIPENLLPHVFSRYSSVSVDEAFDGGFGIGLAIIKAVCELHNGSVVLKSNRGEGTTVTISVPAKQNHTPLLNNRNYMDVDYTGGFSHILLEFCDVLPHELYYIK